MGEEKKLFTRSFRIDEATMEKFKEISAEIGGNQQETIAKLIEAYEFQKGKQVLSGRAEDIGKFENYAGVLTRMYMSVIEDNQNMTQIVRAEYDAQLGSKDAVIQDLQGQLVTARQLRENAAAKAKSMTDEVSGLKEEISRMEKEASGRIKDLESRLIDKERITGALEEKVHTLQTELERLQGATQSYQAVKESLAGMQKERDGLQQKAVQLEADLARARKTVQETEASFKEQLIKKEQETEAALAQVRAQSALEKEKALLEKDQVILETERRHHEDLQRIEKEKQEEVSLYQQKYLELLERMEPGNYLDDARYRKDT